MVKVENKETLRLLTRRFMKMNRARNVIAVIAIMLTSLLFTSLFVGSVSMILLLLLRWGKTASGQKGCIGSWHPVDNMLRDVYIYYGTSFMASGVSFILHCIMEKVLVEQRLE